MKNVSILFHLYGETHTHTHNEFQCYPFILCCLLWN